MDVELKIDKNFPTPKIVIHTSEVTEQISDLVKKLTDYNSYCLIGYREDEVIMIRFEEIYRIYSQGQKVLVQSGKELANLRYRLYELEEKFAGTGLVRISNSEIVNFKKVKSLDFSISGTITLKFDNGEKSFVSRRYVEKIKSYIGLTKNR
jgi:DNA-binding LytR/AlgR family response regulator